MRITILLIITVLLPIISSAQKVWSLEQCIQYALENNIDIKQQKLSLESREADVLESKGNYLPNLNGFGNGSYNWGLNINPVTNDAVDVESQNMNLSLNSSVNVFNGLRNYNTYKQSRLNLLVGEEDVKNIANNVSLDISSTYLEILFNSENLVNAQRQAKVTSQQLERIRKLVEAGSSPKGDMLQVKSQLANEELAVVNAENTLNLSYIRLKQLLLIPLGEKFEIVIPVDLDVKKVQLPAGSDVVVQSAMDYYPSIQSLNYQLESSNLSISIAKGLYLPTLTLGAGMGTSYFKSIQGITNIENKPMVDQFNDNFSRNVSLSLNVPIFNRFSTYANVQRAKIGRSNTELMLEREKNVVRQNIERAYADAIAAFKRYSATQKSLESFQEAFNYAQKRFAVGLINAVDNNTAKNNLNQAESDLLQAKYEYIFRVKILDFYQGKPLTL